MIDNQEAVKLIDAHRGDAVIVATMNANNVRFGLPSVSTQENLDMPLSGAMGKASNFGLGLALAQPERKVMVLDGDGSLLMNLGAMVTLANQTPENLCHVLFDNGVYAVTGGQPVPGSGRADWEGMAKSAVTPPPFPSTTLRTSPPASAKLWPPPGRYSSTSPSSPKSKTPPCNSANAPPRTMQVAIREMPAILGNN